MANRNNKTLLIIIIVLLITNGIMLYLINQTPEKEPELSRSERMVNMVQEELNLTPAQVEQYIALRALRDSFSRPIQWEMRMAKMEILQLIRQDSIPPDTLQTLASRVGKSHALMEIEYYNHFKRMQKMLQDNQQPLFDSLLYRMIYRTTGAGDSLPKKSETNK